MSITTNRRIVFVCVENSCRSQIAEAFGKMYAGPNVDVFSAGSRPSGQVNPKAIASMAEIGYDLSAHGSKSLDDLPRVEFDYAVTMGCGDECPHLQARVRLDWGIPDPKHLPMEEFRKVRELIALKVRDLLANLG
ncbi:MAG: arsenate reductase ArsC [Planctomycetes bacterium]|jgi:protein-tyrosine-phosphatase|nr:arsenate reductase ArsC [Planctomycetota bacterium]